MVSRSARILFVHVQKTGGTTMDHALWEALPDAERASAGSRHATLREALRKRPEFADYWSFGFVRNPWARMYSWHAMILRRGEAADAGNAGAARRIAQNPFWRRVLAEYPSFESFIMDGTDNLQRLRRPQIAYLRTENGTADFIGRTETFARDAAVVFRRIGVEPPSSIESRRNAGPPTDYRVHYTPAMRDRVAKVFQPDIDAFGYDFDTL